MGTDEYIIACGVASLAARDAPAKAAAGAMLRALRAATHRVRIANDDGDPILSAWLPDAYAAIDAAVTAGITDGDR